MSDREPPTADPDSTDRTDQSERGGATDRLRNALSGTGPRGRSGTVAALAGGALLARAVRSLPRRKGRAAVQGLLGAGLLAVGLRRRRSEGHSDGKEESGSDSGPRHRGEKTVSDEAHAERERGDVLNQSEQNPRGTSGAPDLDESGDVEFTEDAGGPHAEPHLDESIPGDPRDDDEASVDDDAVEIDLSEASMADEASEATGPTPEQSQPAQTEDTEPEPSPPEDASHVEADAAADPDAAAEPGTGGDESDEDEDEED